VRTITVTGAHGTATLDLLRARLTFSDALAPDRAITEYQRNEMFIEEAANFLDCVERRQMPAVTLDDGIMALRVALAVKESMRSGRTVELA
jgi:predicted dehydrogenase